MIGCVKEGSMVVVKMEGWHRFPSFLAFSFGILFCSIPDVNCLDNGLALTPPSKYNIDHS